MTYEVLPSIIAVAGVVALLSNPYGMSSGGYTWFRVYGYGLHIRDASITPTLFSERYGYTKPLKIGKYRIKILKPNNR